MPHGGRRPGAGKPKGYKHQHTMDKAAAREFVRQRVTEALEGMLASQIAHAQGLKYLVARNTKTGKFERVTPAMLDAADDALQARIEVWEKDPSVQAFTDLLNRALDKPAEHVEVTGQDGKPLEIIVKKPW